MLLSSTSEVVKFSCAGKERNWRAERVLRAARVTAHEGAQRALVVRSCARATRAPFRTRLRRWPCRSGTSDEGAALWELNREHFPVEIKRKGARAAKEAATEAVGKKDKAGPAHLCILARTSCLTVSLAAARPGESVRPAEQRQAARS
eukprot:15483987-Alexandrium_andersonii.AAC.1